MSAAGTGGTPIERFRTAWNAFWFTPGNTLTLTIDLALQQRAEALLAGKKGAIVMLDVNTGGVLALTLRGIPFSISAAVGFIALAGIEVRNSILFVDFAKNEMHRGLDIEEAVLRAGQTRMRPIWVTDLTMMAGAFAILFDPIFQGMAIGNQQETGLDSTVWRLDKLSDFDGQIATYVH